MGRDGNSSGSKLGTCGLLQADGTAVGSGDLSTDRLGEEIQEMADDLKFLGALDASCLGGGPQVGFRTGARASPRLGKSSVADCFGKVLPQVLSELLQEIEGVDCPVKDGN